MLLVKFLVSSYRKHKSVTLLYLSLTVIYIIIAFVCHCNLDFISSWRSRLPNMHVFRFHGLNLKGPVACGSRYCSLACMEYEKTVPRPHGVRLHRALLVLKNNFKNKTKQAKESTAHGSRWGNIHIWFISLFRSIDATTMKGINFFLVG